MIAIALLWTIAAAGPAGPPTRLDSCRQFEHYGKKPEAATCFARLALTGDPFLQAEAARAAGRYNEANTYFRQAYKQYGNSAEVKTEWGKLFLERFNAAEASNLFTEALKADPNYVPAYLGMARISAERYDTHAVDLVHEALKKDPKSVEAHELLAYLALEDDDQKAAVEEGNAALKLSGEALDALAVLGSMDYLHHDWTNARSGSSSVERLLQINPTYAQAFTTAGHFLEIHARYEEAIKLYREALRTDEKAWAARSALGINLMRLAQYTEAKQQFEQCYQAGYRNAETVNSLRFLDTVQDYRTVRSRDAILVLYKKEAALLRPFMEPELERAVNVYERKYKMKLPAPVRLEVYPNHDDFIVRTLGLPGQGGLLGVTFGLVVAMDSPSARAAGEFNWDSTLWHELSHVYILTATHHLVPRWFTEGLAVHEEGAASKAWGNRLTPDIIEALAQKRLLPVSELDRGFVRPTYPAQVLVSYYQAGKICDFIAQRWGDGAVMGMVQSYAKRITTPDAIQANLHLSAEAFDKDFAAWLDRETGGVRKNFANWQKQVPAAGKALDKGSVDEAISYAQAARDAYPEYVGPHSPYQTMASAWEKKGDLARAQAAWEQYRDLGGRDLPTLKKLAETEERRKQPEQAVATLRELETVYLSDQKAHEQLGRLYLDEHKPAEAVREFQAVVDLKPNDEAQAHFDLARALQAAARPSDAKDEVLSALEAAPNFRPAQQLLLQLSQ